MDIKPLFQVCKIIHIILLHLAFKDEKEVLESGTTLSLVEEELDHD